MESEGSNIRLAVKMLTVVLSDAELVNLHTHTNTHTNRDMCTDTQAHTDLHTRLLPSPSQWYKNINTFCVPFLLN